MELLLLLSLFGVLGLVLRTEGDSDPDEDAGDDAPAEDDKEKPEDIYDIGPDDEDESGDETKTPGDADAPGPDEEDEEPEADVSGFDNDLVAQARGLGFVDSEISEFGSDAGLRRSIALVGDRAPAATDVVADDEVGRVTGSTTEGEAPGDEGKYKPFEVNLADEEYDTEMVGTIKGINDHHEQRIEGALSRLDDLEARQEAQGAAVFQRFFDGACEDLGSDFESVVGKGPGRELSEGSTEFQNRMKIVDQMNTIDAGRQNNGLPRLEEEEVFKQAVRSVFGDEQVTFAKREIRNQARRRKSKIGARPTNRSGAAEDRIEVAGARITAMQESAGAGDPEAEDEF